MVVPDYHPNALKLRQEDWLNYEASLGYRMRPCFKILNDDGDDDNNNN